MAVRWVVICREIMDGTVERYLSLLRQGLWGAGGRPSAGPVVPVGEKEGENLTAQTVEGERWQGRENVVRMVGERLVEQMVEGEMLQEGEMRQEGESVVLQEGENVVRKVGEEEFAVGQQQSTTGLVVRFSEEERYQNELLFLRFTWHLHVAVLGEVKAKLDGAGIPFVLLKGLGCDFYYPEYGLRNLGDIDIYVGEENYGRAAEVFGCDAAASRSPKHFSVTVQDVTVEVHRACEILPSRRADRHFRRLAAEGLFLGPAAEYRTGSDAPATSNGSAAEAGSASGSVSSSADSGSAAEGAAARINILNIGGVEVRVPQDDFNAIYLFVHFFDHFLGGGCGLRQVCDWALFLHARRDSLDRDYLASALEDLGLTNAWRTFGALAVRHLGLPAGSLPCSGLPAAGLPDAGLPDAGLPAASLSAAGVPDDGLPAAGVPDDGQLTLLPPRLARRADWLLRVMLEMGNFGKIRKQERRRRFGTGFLSRKLGSLLGALHHSFEMLALFPVHSLRGISQTLVNSTAKSLRQLFSRG